MRISKSTWLAATLFALLFTACQREAPVPDDSLVFLPESTAAVTAIRARQLIDKADFAAIRQSEEYRNMVEEARANNPVWAKVLEDPDNSGVDLSKNMYIAVELQENKKPLVTISFSIANAETFEALLKSADVEAQPVADRSYRLASPSHHSALAWNDEVAIIGMAKEGADVQAAIKRYLETKPEKSVAQNKNLRRALAQEFDIANWLSSDFLLDSEIAKGSTALMNYDEEDLRGNYIQHFLTFEDGLIRSQTALAFKNRIASDLSMLFRDKVKTDFVKLAPEGQPVFFMTVAFDMDGINQLLVEKYSKGLAEGGLKEYGLSTGSLLKTLKGDILLAAYGPEEGYEKNSLLFAAGINDEATLQTLIDAALQENKIEKLSDNRYQFLEWKREMKDDSTYTETKVHIEGQLLLHGGLLYMASNPALLDKVENGRTGMSGPVAKHARALAGKHIFTALGDIEALENLRKEAGEASPKQIESIEATASRQGTELILNLADKDHNSLKTLIDIMGKAHEEKEEPRESEI